MILVLGGTTEGRKAVQVLEEAGKPFYYSTRGGEQDVSLVHATRLVGGMDAVQMADFCRANEIKLIINATHPFAEGVHRNVAEVSEKWSIPCIRYERQYPRRASDIVWCKDYEDAISKLFDAGIQRLLALTGVQTIGKLKPYWMQHECWFRILQRESSQEMAQREGFPTDHLVFYPDDSMNTLHPNAILTKESGESGGFIEKVEEARRLGIRIFAVERPLLPKGFAVCNGPHGLRLLVQRLVPDFFELHTGITTGTCATAAAIAALTHQSSVLVRIPDGEDIPVRIHKIEGHSACVIKDAGDDPDLTNGLEVWAEVRLYSASGKADGYQDRIIVKGGEGIGTVTLPGLGLPIGSPAINPVPQQMICNNLLPLLKEDENLEVTISVPQGREIGAKTFNPRIGVVGGISIIGTSGIVRPFSNEARIESIRREMAVGVAMCAPRIVINSGAKSEKYLLDYYPDLPQQAFVHYGNFIGEAIRFADELGVKLLTLGLMIGKAVKLAEGHLNTHSHEVTMNREFLAQLALQANIPSERFENLNLARELWNRLTPDEMQRFAEILISRCHACCDPLLPNGKLDILLISETGKVVKNEDKDKGQITKYNVDKC